MSAFHGAAADVLFDAPQRSLPRSGFKRLEGTTWLNDEVISAYTWLLNERDAKYCAADPSRRPCYAMHTFFASTLHGSQSKTPERISRALSKYAVPLDVFSLDKWLVPINIGGMHWAAMVVHCQKMRVEYVDSMGGRGIEFMEGMLAFLKYEHRVRKGRELPPGWQMFSYQHTTPQQANGCDCGVFACITMDFIMEGLPFDFRQDDPEKLPEGAVVHDDMPRFRQVIGTSILAREAPASM
ncbi:hypothetical protein JKP88DRAFT_157183 [Tribonema minus]|uniref:Ubiquitin-like protease family profile domain-containing protein n=1 Tax=Tribonema minus TaxID=303371 RepID=A0A835YXA5_9STRA|nr:hypothetical protein JKP88DRAFT_157183 [Tribonema minus]